MPMEFHNLELRWHLQAGHIRTAQGVYVLFAYFTHARQIHRAHITQAQTATRQVDSIITQVYRKRSLRALDGVQGGLGERARKAGSITLHAD